MSKQDKWKVMDSLEKYLLEQFKHIPPLPEGWEYSWDFEHKVEDGEIKVVVTGTAVRKPRYQEYDKIKFALR